MADINMDSHGLGSSLIGTSIPETIMDVSTGTIQQQSPIIPQNNFPPPKTDKPRPHICLTCGRAFARLEHLKRHERSHTKEKPFECPECARCFARRDLLLRHQQKLHQTTTPAARPRANRRESTTSNAGNKVRKNSATQPSGTGIMRPRANTISHVQVDVTGAGFAAATNNNISAAPRKRPGHSTHPSLCGLPTMATFQHRGLAAMPRNRAQPGLAKIETQGLPMNLSGNLRTAPAFQGCPTGFGQDHIFSPGNTINPAQLHFLDSPNPLNFDTPISPFHPNFNFMSTPGVEDDGTFDWVNDAFDSSMAFGDSNEHAIVESSPSAMSTGGSPVPETYQETFPPPAVTQTTDPWQPSALSQAPMMADYPLDMSGFQSGHLNDSMSPMHVNNGFDEHHFQPQTTMGPIPDLISTNGLHVPFTSNADTPTTSTASVGSSNRHSSVTSVCTDAITDSTRAALLASLSQPQSGYSHHRNFSSPAGTLPKPANGHTRSRSVGNVSLPSTYDLQRYIGAYIQNFHPHMPFLHIPTLSFNSPVYTNTLPGSDHFSNHTAGITGGGGCLMLAMAAIGALYESDSAASKDLFDLAKQLMTAYLNERRRANISSAVNGHNDSNNSAAETTPIWLVQAMLLNIIYGHNSGDQMFANIASTHCAALVTLARSAGLPISSNLEAKSAGDSSEAGLPDQATGDMAWLQWKTAEEKRRTMYAVFIVSSVLVSAYNHPPAMTNSEIYAALPCEEDVWAAESSEAWTQLGGPHSGGSRTSTFMTSLSWLLSASQRQPQDQYGAPRLSHPLQTGSFRMDLPPAETPISTFGCLVLIHALHNYIWETRQRHIGRQWTVTETDAMHGHVEPALVAWQAIWASHPQHSLKRPNPYGMGPLSADSIPLLDLAYVRLFVNLGRSKEAFWSRDWDQMAYEISKGADIVQHADADVPTSTYPSAHGDRLQGSSPSHGKSENGQPCKRERHMRKAAFHAAHSLCTSDKPGVCFAGYNSRELSIVASMCAFDCAQVLAEWVTTVQERVGQYLGILGHDPIDFEAVPAIMLVDQEDIKLFQMIDQYLSNMDLKQALDNSNSRTANNSTNAAQNKPQGSGYGSKILMVTMESLESAVWPVIRVMSRSLESQAALMEERTLKSARTADQTMT